MPADEHEPPDPRARVIAAVLWAALWSAVITVIVMTWHPWVIGDRSVCPARQAAGWDGRCRPTDVLRLR